MIVKLIRWLFYLIPLGLVFIWGILKGIFTYENSIMLWDWFIAGDSSYKIINIAFRFIEIFTYFLVVELFIFLIRLTHDYSIYKKLVYIRVCLVKEDSKIDNEKRSEKDFKEKVSIMQQFYRAISEIKEINIGNQLHSAIWQDNFVSMELLLENKEVNFYVVTRAKYQSIVEKQISSFYPNANFFIEKKAYHFRKRGNVVGGYYVNSVKKFWHTIKTYDTFENDPLNDVINSFSKAGKNETAAYQVIVRPVSDKSFKKKAQKAADQFFKNKLNEGFFTNIPFIGSVFRFLGDIFSDKSLEKNMAPGASSGDSYIRMLAPKEEYAKHMGEKAGGVAFEVSIRLIASAKTRERTTAILKDMIVSSNIYRENYGNYLDASRIIIIEWLNGILMYLAYRFRFRTFFNDTSIFSAKELAGLYHFPDAKYNQISIIKWMSYKLLPAPTNLPHEGLLLGTNDYRGMNTPVYMNQKDRSRHFYVVGKSGSGKSAFISFMARQDAKNGTGFGVIDPHGDLIEDILRYIPKERARDVILFDPSDTERPIGLNMLEAHTSEQKDRASLDAMEIFIKLFGNEIFGPRIQHYFRNAALTLMDDEEEGATLIDIPRMFTDDDFQKRKVAKCKNTVVRSFWEREIAKTGEREKSEMIPYFSAKFGPFVTNATIRNVIGQPKSGFDIRKVMDEGKILLVNLSKGKIGNLNAQLLGLIFVNKISMAAMSRADIPEKERTPFYFYVDEFQNFATSAFADILSEARKYKLALIMAHQYIGQLTQSSDMTYEKNNKMKDAVFGNVGTMMSFKVGAEDAEYFEKEYSPVLSAQDIIGISNYKAYIKLNIKNATSRPFSLSTIWETGGSDKLAKILKEYSRMKYGRKRVFVDQEIETRLGM